MKFSKLLTTAMMSVALVASSSAFAAEETTWWSMNFDGLTVAEESSLTKTLNDAYGTDQNGVWSTEEGDLSELVDNKLKLNTQGTDLTWKPNGENDTSLITYVDADVTFVGSDTAPTISETDVHTAVYLKNFVDDTTGDVSNRVLCAWATVGSDVGWVSLTGVQITETESYGLRIMLDGNVLSFYIDGTVLTPTSFTKQDGTVISVNSDERLFSAKEGSSGAVKSVSFRGTGFVDNFAASQEAKAVYATATIVDCKAFLNNEETTWEIPDYMNQDEFATKTVTLNGNTAISGAEVFDESLKGDPLAAIKLVSNTQTFELVRENDVFVGDEDIVLTTNYDDSGYKCYTIGVKTSNLTADAVYSFEFYYGEYTPSEDPDPKPVQLGTPSVEATTTANSVTLAWDAVANATGYEVTINGTTTNVTETTFTASDLTASTDYSYSVVAKGDGENYTDSEEATGTATTTAAPAPDPVQLSTPSVAATTTANSVTLTWDAVANATGYEVTINGTTTTVTDPTFTASDLTASTDYTYSVVAKGDGENYTDSEAATGTVKTAAAAVEPDPITIAAISGPVDGNVVVTVVPAEEGGKIKAGVNYWAVVSATLDGDSIAQEPVTVDADTESLQITVPATGDSLFIKVKADTATVAE